MGKTFSAGLETALAAGEFGVIDCFEIFLPVVGTQRITNAGYDVQVTLPDSSVQTFTGNGLLLTAQADRQQMEFAKPEISIAINGASSLFLTAIQSGEHLDARIVAYKVFFTDEEDLGTGAGETITMYDGKIIGGNFSVNDSESKVMLAASHTLYNFDKRMSYVTSNDSLRIKAQRKGIEKLFAGENLVQNTAQPRWGVK